MSPVLLVASVIFGLVVLFFAVYSFFIVYILLEFALSKSGAILLIAVFIGVSIVLLFTIFMYLSQVNWSASAFPFFEKILTQ